MNVVGSTIGTETISTSTTKSRIDTIIERVASERGLLSAFRSILTGSLLPAFMIFKLLLKYKGDEKKIQEKLLKRSKKLVEKLEKYSLTSQYNELTKDILVARPKIVVKILRRLGGDISAARQYILSIPSLVTSRLLDEQVSESYPNFESIYESLLRKGISVAPSLVLNLLLRFEGSISRVEESLLGRRSPTILNELFEEGRNLIRSLRENIFGGEETSTRRSTVSPLRSRINVGRSEREELEDEVYVQRLVEGNRFLISNGFTDARENIRVLKRFGGDATSSLRYLVLRSGRTPLSEDTFRDTYRDTTSGSSFTSPSDYYGTTYGSRLGRSNVYPEYSTYTSIPGERYLITPSNVSPTAYNTYIPVSEAYTYLASKCPFLNPTGTTSRIGDISLRPDIASRIIPSRNSTTERYGERMGERIGERTGERMGDRRGFTSSSGMSEELGESSDMRSREMSRYELEDIMRRMMGMMTTLSNYVSTSTPSTSMSGVDSRGESSGLRDTRKSSMSSVSDPEVEVMVNKIDSKLKI